MVFTHLQVRFQTALLAACMVCVAAPAAWSANRTHKVESGDTLGGLAHLYGCSVADLRAANSLKNSNLIRHGQQLEIPPCGDDADLVTYTVRPGDVPDSIAERFGVSWTDIRRANPKAPRDARRLRVGFELKIPPPKQTVQGSVVEYRVQPGDTLDAIAVHFGVSVAVLRKENPKATRDPKRLRVGKTLRIRARKNKRPPKVFTYKIRAGDNPSTIAKRYRTSWSEIRRLNPRISDDPRRLRVGQKLKLYQRRPLSSSQGKPHAGRLVDGIQLQKGSGYYIRRPHNAWGTEDTINGLLEAIDAVGKKHKGVHDVAIGDISRKQGGKLRRHRSHQSGRDVDIGFWFTNQKKRGPKGFISAYRHPLDMNANWTFILSLVGKKRAESKVDYIFLDYKLQKKFYQHAVKKGWKSRQLERIFQYRPRGEEGKRSLRGIIRHEPGHGDHFHIRFKCARGDEDCA